jgi:hypothetical protein
MALEGTPSAKLDVLNRLQSEVAHPFDTVRHDAFTHEFARYTMAYCTTSSKVVATALKALGLNWKNFDPTIGKPLDIFKH